MDNESWDRTYRSDGRVSGPSRLLHEHRDLLTGGKALDIAMGSGRNAVMLASCGYDVTGIDRSAEAVSLADGYAQSSGVRLHAVQADALTYPVEADSFDLIADFYFLERSLIPSLKQGLKKKGLIFFETYTTGQARFGRPRNPDYLLKPNELLELFLDFFILFYHERVETDRAVAGLIAQKV